MSTGFIAIFIYVMRVRISLALMCSKWPMPVIDGSCPLRADQALPCTIHVKCTTACVVMLITIVYGSDCFCISSANTRCAFSTMIT